jgi:type IX secretion system PorP/SprF family membrane protein
MRKIKIVFFSFILFSGLHAQDPFFTQYNSAPIYLNPGFTGSTGEARAAASFRDQWPAISGNFITTNASYDQYFEKLHGGLGINLQNDLAGQATVQTNNAALTYAFHLPLFGNKLVVQPGISVGLLNKSIDWRKLNFGDMIDPRRGFVISSAEQPKRTTVNCLDISTGFIAYTDRITLGFSAAHLTQPDIGFFGTTHLPMRFAFNASGVIGHLPGDFENKFSVIPQIALVAQGNSTMIIGGISTMYKNYTFGIAYRDGDAAIAMIGFQNNLFRVSYSYDYTISDLGNANTGGSHEIAVQFFLFKGRRPDGYLSPATIAF